MKLTAHQQGPLDPVFDRFAEAMRGSAQEWHGAPLFTTAIPGEALWATYLAALPPEDRQFHNCHCCKKFITTYGGLVTIDPSGNVFPIMWQNSGHTFYEPARRACEALLAKAKITGPQFFREASWGVALTGPFSHFCVTGTATEVRGQSPHEVRAAKLEARKNVKLALKDYKPAVLDEALRALRSSHLPSAHKFIAPLEWLRALHDLPKGPQGSALFWLAIATAPEGFCHPRAAVTSTLLDDILAGKSFEALRDAFARKVGGTVYQRPTAPPKTATIEKAEALFKELGYEKALGRRAARRAEVPCFWSPKGQEPSVAHGALFTHLQSKEAPRTLALPRRNCTWQVFLRDHLPLATSLEYQVPHSRAAYVGLLAPEEPSAPLIFKWTNGFSWYLHAHGGAAHQWSLSAGSWASVTGICEMPPVWTEPKLPHINPGHILLLEGAKDLRLGAGNALFPECLRQELHKVRSVIEAYSAGAEIGGQDEATANGLQFTPESAQALLRLNGKDQFQIDRWE